MNLPCKDCITFICCKVTANNCEEKNSVIKVLFDLCPEIRKYVPCVFRYTKPNFSNPDSISNPEFSVINDDEWYERILNILSIFDIKFDSSYLMELKVFKFNIIRRSIKWNSKTFPCDKCIGYETCNEYINSLLDSPSSALNNLIQICSYLSTYLPAVYSTDFDADELIKPLDCRLSNKTWNQRLDILFDKFFGYLNEEDIYNESTM